MIGVLVAIAAVIVCIFLGLATFRRTRIQCPGPQPNWLLGHLSYIADPIKRPVVLQELSQQYGRIFYFQFGPAILAKHAFVISDPDLCEKVLRSDKASYTVSQLTSKQFTAGIGKFSMVSLDGEVWKKHRRMTQPLFHSDFLGYSVSIMAQETRCFLRSLKALPSGSPVEMYSFVNNLFLDIFGLAGFGYDLQAQENPTGPLPQAINAVLDYFANSSFSLGLWFHMLLHPLDTWQRRRHNQVFDDLISSMISKRLKDTDTTQQQRDLLSLMLSSTDPESKYPLSFDEVRDEIVTFLFGGFETGAGTLCWFFYHMAQNPDIQAKVQEELDAVLGEEVTFETIQKLKYLSNCIKESQRLIPVAPIFLRDAREDTELAGYFIPKGSMIFINTWTMHHSESIFKNAQKFDPSRWDDKSFNPSFSYLPFGGGNRRCVGLSFAQAELKTISALLLKNFTFRLDETRPVTIDWKITYSPRKVFFHLMPRN